MSHTNYCFAGFTKALHARIGEIDQCVVEYCRVDIVKQWEGFTALQLLEICMYSARSSKTDMAVDELTLKVTAKLRHAPPTGNVT